MIKHHRQSLPIISSFKQHKVLFLRNIIKCSAFDQHRLYLLFVSEPRIFISLVIIELEPSQHPVPSFFFLTVLIGQLIKHRCKSNRPNIIIIVKSTNILAHLLFYTLILIGSKVLKTVVCRNLIVVLDLLIL